VRLFKELKTLAVNSAWILRGRGTLAKLFAHNAINSALKVALQDQKIPAFTIHGLRRTAATLLHEKGWASDVVEKALNHTIGGVRGVYNRHAVSLCRVGGYAIVPHGPYHSRTKEAAGARAPHSRPGRRN
jgi:integrase